MSNQNVISQGVPGQILVSHYIAERENEVIQLLNATIERRKILTSQHANTNKTTSSLKRPIGRVHYRTRSHKSYKIPRRRIRKKRKASTAINSGIDQNRCRKHRRRTNNIDTFTQLKDQINSNPTKTLQHSKKLPTHVWHAKRMKIDRNYFGYQIPLCSNSRSLKSLEKLIKTKSFLYDYSFYEVIKIITKQSDFFHFLQNHTDPDSVICQELPKIGKRENFAKEYDVLVYRKGSFPEGLIGPISLTVNYGKEIQILFWSHPSIRVDIKNILTNSEFTFAMEEQIPLSRIWLSGTDCNNILQKISSFSPLKEPDESSSEKRSFLYYSLNDSRRLHNVWKSGQVLSVCIQDLRHPEQEYSPPTEPKSFQWPKNSAKSDLWSTESLSQLVQRFPSNTVVQQMQSAEKFKKWNSVTKSARQLFGFDIKGSNNKRVNRTPSSSSLINNDSSSQLNHQLPAIPILLIKKANQYEHSQQALSNSFCNDWFIILPRCYVSSFYYHLIRHHRMVSIGLQEMQMISRMKGQLIFPNDYPDTSAGWRYWKQYYYEQIVGKELKKPLAKRLTIDHSAYLMLPKLIVRCNSKDNLSDQEELHEEAEDLQGENQLLNQAPHSEEVVSSKDTEGLQPIVETKPPLEEECVKDQEDTFFQSFLVVRERKYFTEMIPPRYIPPSSSSSAADIAGPTGIHHCLHHVDWQYTDEFPIQENEFIAPIPSTPKAIFLFLKLFPTSRGIPFTGAMLFQPTIKDLRQFIQHKIQLKLHKLRRKQAKALVITSSPLVLPQKKRHRSASFDTATSMRDNLQYNPHQSNEWKGINLLSIDGNEEKEEEKDRVLLGIVSNGYAPHSNPNALNQQTAAIALVNIQLLHAMIAHYYGRYSYPLSHLLILFQNPQSRWLRPATYEFV